MHPIKRLVAAVIVAVCAFIGAMFLCVALVENAEAKTASALFSAGKVVVYQFDYNGVPCLILAEKHATTGVAKPVSMTCDWQRR